MMLPPNALPRSLREHVNPPPTEPAVRDTPPVVVRRAPVRAVALRLAALLRAERTAAPSYASEADVKEPA